MPNSMRPPASPTANMRLIAAAELTGTVTNMVKGDTKSTSVPNCCFSISTQISSSCRGFLLTLRVDKKWPAGGEVLIECAVTRCSKQEVHSVSELKPEWASPVHDEPQFHLMTCNTINIETRVKRGNWLCARIKLYGAAPTSVLLRGLQEARLKGGSPKCDALLCAGGAELPVHRLVLATHSSVFATMFDGDFKEAADGRVEIADASREATEKLVEHLYTETVQDWAGLELELLHLSDKYLMQPLWEDCKLQLWLADGPRALSLLLGADDEPLVSAAQRERWIRVIAAQLPLVAKDPQWASLRLAQPLLTEVFVQYNASQQTAMEWQSYN